MRRNRGRRPGHVVDPVRAFLHRLGLGRAYTPEEREAHMRGFAEQVDRETAHQGALYRCGVAQLLGVYDASLGSNDLIARSRGLGETIRVMRALHLLPRSGVGSVMPGARREIPRAGAAAVGRTAQWRAVPMRASGGDDDDDGERSADAGDNETDEAGGPADVVHD